jgi:hypothetical protein
MTRTTSAIYPRTNPQTDKQNATDVGQPEAALRRAVSGVSLGKQAIRPAIQQNQGFPSDQERINWTKPNFETGEVTPYTVTPNRKNEAVAKVFKTPQQTRAERWSLKATASELLDGTRVSKCYKHRSKGKKIVLLLDRSRNKAFYGGLQTCGSVWGCPICAAKISERRRTQLQQAIQRAKELGLQVMLLTLTIPHGMGDDVGTITDGLIDSWDSIKRNRAGRAIRDQIELVGTVRAMEVTHGQNGFHPHLHILLFIKSDIRPSEVQRLYAPLWQSACVTQGLPRPSDSHGCKVDDGSKAAAYVAKGGWGLESEMTKGHTKTAGEGKGMTPWDMLRAVLHDKDEHAAKLFKVYYENFKGRRQLCWSKGLQKMLAVVDFTDEEIAAQEEEQADVFTFITVEQWRVIYARRWQAVLCDIAENNPDAVAEFLESLTRSKEKQKGGDPACGEVSFCADDDPTNSIK